MLGPDPEQQRRMAGEMDRSIEQIERETSAFFVRLVGRWAVRWAVVFAVIFLLTQSVDWLGWSGCVARWAGWEKPSTVPGTRHRALRALPATIRRVTRAVSLPGSS